MIWIDQSTGGEVLEWRRHFLSKEMELRGKPHLAHEPAWRDPGEVRDKLLTVTPTQDGVQYTWGAWTRLQVELDIRDRFLDLGSERRRWLAANTREISWLDLPPCDALELTPFDTAGAVGATARVSRPLDLPWIPFEFRYVEEPPSGLRIASRQKAWLDRMELVAVGLEQTGHLRFRRGTPVGLGRHGGFLRLDKSFQGIVAIYGSVGPLRRLLDCTTVFELNERGRPQSPEEWRAARKHVGCAGGTDRPWPRRTEDLLERIREEALASGVPHDLVADLRQVRGLHRSLVLRACPVAVSPPERAKDIQTLSRGEDLRQILGSLTSPQVLSLLERLPTPGGRLWVLQNASHPDLAEIVDWAAAHGGAGLEMAKGLLRSRHALLRLAREIRPDCPQGQEIATLTTEIDRALDSLQRPADLETRIAKLEALAKASREKSPTAADPPPITVKEHEAWWKKRQQSRIWRNGVDSILTYCETGEWREDGEAADGDPIERDLGELAERARALAEAVELPATDRAAAEAARLSARLDQVFDHADHEPPSAKKRALLDRLAAGVRPVPGQWAAMHGVLKDAAERARRWPKLAEEVGVTPPPQALGERVRLALLLLELDAALRQAARAWPRDAARLVPGTGVEQLLASLGDPAIERAHRECRALAHRLSWQEDLPEAPGRPAAPTLAACRQWWRQLEELFSTLGRLREKQADLESKLRWVRENLVPQAQGYLERCAALPKERWTPEIKELEEAMREMTASNGSVTQQVYSRFRNAFGDAERLYEQR